MIAPKIKIEDAKDVAYHWDNLMPTMAMEESGELIQAISKLERLLRSDDYMPIEKFEECKENLIKEMRDMYISLAALTVYYEIHPNVIQAAINEKLNKRY